MNASADIALALLIVIALQFEVDFFSLRDLRPRLSLARLRLPILFLRAYCSRIRSSEERQAAKAMSNLALAPIFVH